MINPPQIVLDTNVVIAALRSRRGASSLLLSLIGTGAFDLHLSVPLALEVESVIGRQRSDLGLSVDDVEGIVDSLCALSIHHKVYFLWRPYLRDAGDDHVLELAVAARCTHIVTYNLRDFEGTDRFGIRVLDPKAFLQQTGSLP